MTVNKAEKVVSSVGNYITRKAKATGKFIADRTSIGRMRTRDEKFAEAWLNAGKQSREDVSKFYDNYTPFGRMATKGESYGEAWINCSKEQLKKCKDIID